MGPLGSTGYPVGHDYASSGTRLTPEAQHRFRELNRQHRDLERQLSALYDQERAGLYGNHRRGRMEAEKFRIAHEIERVNREIQRLARDSRNFIAPEGVGMDGRRRGGLGMDPRAGGPGFAGYGGDYGDYDFGDSDFGDFGQEPEVDIFGPRRQRRRRGGMSF